MFWFHFQVMYLSKCWVSGRKLSKILVFQVNLQFFIEIIVRNLVFQSFLSLKLVKNLVFISKIVKILVIPVKIFIFKLKTCQNFECLGENSFSILLPSQFFVKILVIQVKFSSFKLKNCQKFDVSGQFAVFYWNNCQKFGFSVIFKLKNCQNVGFQVENCQKLGFPEWNVDFSGQIVAIWMMTHVVRG